MLLSSHPLSTTCAQEQRVHLHFASTGESVPPQLVAWK